MDVLLNAHISREVEHVQLCALRQLRRDPRQPVLSYAEDVQTAAAPDLNNRGRPLIRLHVGQCPGVP